MTFALKIENLSIEFGGLKAVSNLNLMVPSNSVFGLIGPNGAGKTTVFNLLTGIYQPTQGEIKIFGHSLLRKKPYEIAAMGLVRTFQNIRLFKELSVLENILIALDQNPALTQTGLFAAIWRTKSALKNQNEKIDQAMHYLELFNLEDRQATISKSLPYGDQRKLEISRAMASGAQILLLDEPAAGLNGKETIELMKILEKIRNKNKISILLIEHDMKLVMGICQEIAVLDYGEKIAQGTPSEIQKNPLVIEAYLGKGAVI